MLRSRADRGVNPLLQRDVIAAFPAERGVVIRSGWPSPERAPRAHGCALVLEPALGGVPTSRASGAIRCAAEFATKLFPLDSLRRYLSGRIDVPKKLTALSPPS
jgi:hypothetical protein